jgi:ubiquinone/menaquinone biosynthesis C-methylase UbiE
MINEASKKRKNLGVVVDLSIMDVQQLDFPDNHFDRNELNGYYKTSVLVFI